MERERGLKRAYIKVSSKNVFILFSFFSLFKLKETLEFAYAKTGEWPFVVFGTHF